jgi:pilus assembly protein FimV
MNFDLPGSTGLAPAEVQTAAPVDTAARQLDDPLFDLDAMNFELPEPIAPAATADDQPAAAAGSALPQFDMSGIDLDLPPAETADEAPPVSGSAGEMSAMHMEMETKLDLAIAYQEIGDKEGARELLDEVIRGGNSEQVGKANAMLVKLA